MSVRHLSEQRSPFAALGDVLEDLSGVPEVLTRLERVLRDGVMPEKRLLRVREVAELTGLSDDVVLDLIKRGAMPSRQIEGVRVTLVALTDLDAWVESLPRRQP